jgi:YVTN family beta-propeller protein
MWAPVVALLAARAAAQGGAEAPLPGMPPLLDPQDVYAAARPGELTPPVRDAVPRIYVPNTREASVDVIDPATYRVVDHFGVGHEPQHVTPSYDLKTLWVLADRSSTLTRIDPVTGRKQETIPVTDPYNMYYTPDGRYAIVVAERKKRLDFRDAQSMALVHSLRVPCRGVDHMDFSASGRYLIASCEFSGEMVKVDVAGQEVVGTLKLPGHGMPQDVIAKIFDPFFTTKEFGKGTGLGLTVVRGIIEEHSGTIQVKSEPGVGTVFTICLPIHGEPSLKS